jgi:hypothetical protein
VHAKRQSAKEKSRLIPCICLVTALARVIEFSGVVPIRVYADHGWAAKATTGRDDIRLPSLAYPAQRSVAERGHHLGNAAAPRLGPLLIAHDITDPMDIVRNRYILTDQPP